MKICIGKREKPMAQLGGSLQIACHLTEQLGGSIEAGPRLDYQLGCKHCSASYVVTLSEDAFTGEVFYEGPATCKCGYVFMKDPPPTMLSQDAIEDMFGD